MQVRGGVLFDDNGQVFEGELTAGRLGGLSTVTKGDVLAALDAADASAGDVLTADGDGGAEFAAIPS